MLDQKQRGDHDVDLDEELDAELLDDARPVVGKRNRADARYRGAAASLGPARLRALMQRAMAGVGTPLPAPLRARFERSLGVDLGAVRVHRDHAAARAARAVDAVAFAHQGQVFLGDRAATEGPAGERLLAHEIAHAVQQRGAAAGGAPALTTPGDALERDADGAAAAMLVGAPARVAPAGAGLVARTTEGEAAAGGDGASPTAAGGKPKVTVTHGPIKQGDPITFDADDYKELYKQVKARADQKLEAGSVSRGWSQDDVTDGDKLVSVTFTIPLTMSLPKWTKRDNQPDADKKKYDTWAASVKAHEDEHVNIYKTTYERLKKEVVGPTAAEATTQANTIDNDAEAAQTRFDATTQPDPLPIPGGTEKVGQSTDVSDAASEPDTSEPREIEGEDVRRSASGEPVGPDAAARLAVARARSGAPLPPWLRARFERALGADLGGVRVHTDTAAADAARAVGARAFAHGQDVYFAEGRYAPDAADGQRLLAHEVAHTMQSAAPAGGTPRLTSPGDALESEADAAADAMVRGAPAEIHAGASDVLGREGEPRADLAEDMLQVTSFVLSPPNGATRAALGADARATDVMIQAGEIQFNASLGLRDGITIGAGQTIQVGSIQTLVSTQRGAVYRRPDGSVAAEYNSAVGEARDAPDENEGRPVPPPWYWQPRDLGDSARTASVQFMDRPRWNIPHRMGDAVLTETRGQENFVTSLAAKRGGTILHLRRMEWAVPWNMQIAPDGSGAGGAVTGATTTAAPSMPAGPTVGERATEVMRFTDVAAARAAGWRTLMRYIADARTQDPTAFQIMSEALLALNPTFSFSVRCAREYSSVGADAVTLSVTGTGTRSSSHSLRQNGTGRMSARLLELFDLGRVSASAGLTIAVSVGGVMSTTSASFNWGWPFPATTDFAVPLDDREYRNAYYLNASASEGGEPEAVPAGAAAATMAPGGGGARGSGGGGDGGAGGMDGGT